MRSRLGILVTAAAMLAIPQLALAEDDVNEQLRLMNERMSQMESQLQATQDELENSKAEVERQQDVIEKAGLDDREGKSGLAGFLYDTQFSGYVAASWNYNFTRPDSTTMGRNGNDTGAFGALGGGAENNGSMGLTAPFHGNHNTFQVDGFFFSMMKPATAESRGGWGVDLSFGQQADIQRGSAFEADDEAFLDGDFAHLYQAYAEYLVPVGSGINIKGGRWSTLVGAESYRYDENWQVTRGLLWSTQPVNHTGLMISGDCDCGIEWALGLANSFSNTMSDDDNVKTFVGRLGYNAETWSFHVNGLYGGNVQDTFLGNFRNTNLTNGTTTSTTNKDAVGILDAVFAWDPHERVSLWVNFDYWWTQNPDSDGTGVFDDDGPVSSLTLWGIAAAGRFAITDRAGVSLRYEYLYFNDADLFFGGAGCGDIGEFSLCNAPPLVVGGFDEQGGADTRLWSLTFTGDYSLTESLVVKAEVRWDQGWAQDSPDRFFVRRTDNRTDNLVFSKENQILGLVQMMYKF